MPAQKKVQRSSKSAIKPIHILFLSCFIILLTAFNLLIYFSPQRTKVVYAKDNTPLVQVYYLKNLLKTHSTYREGWVALAKLQYTLGNIEEARFAVQKVSEIDPNYKELSHLQTLLSQEK